MTGAAFILPVVLPVLFWAGYHYHKDRHLPEPLGYLLLAFLLGVVSYWLGMLMYAGLGAVGLRFDAYLLAETEPLGLLLYALLAIGPIEELAKLLPFLVVIRLVPAFDEPIDGIVYASFIALGFAAVENVHYLQFLTVAEATARGFAGPFVHIVFASIWGYYVGRARLAANGLLKALVAALGGAALVHGAYDYLVIAEPRFALPASALLVAGLWLWRMILLRDLDRAARSTGSA